MELMVAQRGIHTQFFIAPGRGLRVKDSIIILIVTAVRQISGNKQRIRMFACDLRYQSTPRFRIRDFMIRRICKARVAVNNYGPVLWNLITRHYKCRSGATYQCVGNCFCIRAVFLRMRSAARECTEHQRYEEQLDPILKRNHVYLSTRGDQRTPKEYVG